MNHYAAMEDQVDAFMVLMSTVIVVWTTAWLWYLFIQHQLANGM
jgi:hypothetical protein